MAACSSLFPSPRAPRLGGILAAQSRAATRRERSKRAIAAPLFYEIGHGSPAAEPNLTRSHLVGKLLRVNDEQNAYKVCLPVFEGPLDLLLQLIEKHELEITAISLASIADQFLVHLKTVQETDPESIVEFLVIATKLLMLKSLALLPSSTTSPEEHEIVHDLAKALHDYQLFKKAAMALRAREDASLRAYPRTVALSITSQATLEQIPLQELLNALAACLAKHTSEEITVDIPERRYTVEEKITVIEDRLTYQKRVAFSDLLNEATARIEVIVTFLAVLELLRQGRIEVEQEGLFSEIYLMTRQP